MSVQDNSVDLRVETGSDGLTIHLKGRLDSRTTGSVWRRVQDALPIIPLMGTSPFPETTVLCPPQDRAFQAREPLRTRCRYWPV